MATAILDSTTNNDEYDYMKGVQHLADSGALNSLPIKYVFPQHSRPSAAEIAKGESIPIIDVSALDKTPEERLDAIKQLGQACEDWGFFQVVNHGIQESVISSMLDAAHQFFSLPLEEKMKYETKDVLNPVRYGTSFYAEAEQIFNWRDYFKHFCHPELHTPDNPPIYREVAGRYFKETRKLALKLMGAISESLELNSDYVKTVFKDGFQIGTLNLYPPCPEPEQTMGIARHSDHGVSLFYFKTTWGVCKCCMRGIGWLFSPLPTPSLLTSVTIWRLYATGDTRVWSTEQSSTRREQEFQLLH
eukprot:PITA_23352